MITSILCLLVALVSFVLTPDARCQAGDTTVRSAMIMATCRLATGGFIEVGDAMQLGSNVARLYIAKRDADSSLVWSRVGFTHSFGLRDDLSMVTVDAAGNVYAAGTAVESNQRRLVAAVYKFTHDGNLEWKRECGLGVGDPLYISAHPNGIIEIGFERAAVQGTQHVIQYEPTGVERQRWVVAR
jgi:hypothetical protein